jgi:ubiquinone/menaquinone biosynthesis C-methylase UbiE
MKRVVVPELLDVGAGTPQEIAAALADLRRINLWFGGVSTTSELIGRVAESRRRHKFSLLEVAAGSGESIQQAAARLRRRKVELAAVPLDRARAHLDSTGVVADACSLPFRDCSFDLVSCALFAHHLEPVQLLEFVEEALRVARLAVLINDLRRSVVHLAAVYAGFPLYRSRLTRHDAPASVRRAYTAEELGAILKQTSAARIEISKHYLFRMGAIVWKG